jgi:enoyl-CoA hydratase/carnithine racemase
MAGQISGAEAIRAQSERSVRLPDHLQRTHPPSRWVAMYSSMSSIWDDVTTRRGILFTGDIMTAAEAERIGLINHVVSADQLDEKVYGLARRAV